MSNINRILIIRTDRIGDVVLSTPVITATRKAFPDAYIAVMVSSRTKEIVTGNPYLNEVIIYDKEDTHKGIFKTINFAVWLRKKKFDLAIILHTTRRINILCFLARIPKRIGYARRKFDFLLTDRLEYTKRLGEKHEVEYSLDVLRALGVKVEHTPLFMPVKKEHTENVMNMLKEKGLEEGERFIVIHPGASHISKMWPKENFARVGNILTERFNLKSVLVTSLEQMHIGDEIRALMGNNTFCLCGRLKLSELAALLKKAELFISNDSGPVHIACAVGAPVISIFSRNEPGLSPNRWSPIGTKVVAIHKEVGCIKCLAHKCEKNFLCLRSISVEEVVEAATRLLTGRGKN